VGGHPTEEASVSEEHAEKPPPSDADDRDVDLTEPDEVDPPVDDDDRDPAPDDGDSERPVP
jgi:hypothetical protein